MTNDDKLELGLVVTQALSDAVLKPGINDVVTAYRKRVAESRSRPLILMAEIEIINSLINQMYAELRNVIFCDKYKHRVVRPSEEEYEAFKSEKLDKCCNELKELLKHHSKSLMYDSFKGTEERN